MKAFFGPEAKKKVKEAVVAVEAKTSAELVVTVRARSATYRDVDYLVGVGFSLVALMALLFDPLELNMFLFPPGVLFSFVVGSLFSAQLLSPFVVPESRKRDEVKRSAHAAFHEQRIAGTVSRRGILIYASAIERMVLLVVDVGVPEKKLEAELETARAALEAAFSKGEVSAFVEKMKALGDVLAKEMPRAEDDVNELPDEVT